MSEEKWQQPPNMRLTARGRQIPNLSVPTCDVCGEPAPGGDPRNDWLSYHTGWPHRAAHRARALAEGEGFQAAVIVVGGIGAVALVVWLVMLTKGQLLFYGALIWGIVAVWLWVRGEIVERRQRTLKTNFITRRNRSERQ